LKNKDIAQKTGVSLATVSRVLNNSGYVKKETRELVLKTMQELGLEGDFVSKRVSKHKNEVIGVVIPDITNPFFGEVIKGINKVADSEKLNFILCDTDENVDKEIRYLEMLKEQNIKGLIITPATDQNEFNRNYLIQLDNMGVPIVLLDRDIKYSHFDAVFLDSIKGAYEAVEALIKEGHEKIAIIAGPITSKPGRDRVSGYQKALRMNDIQEDDKYMFFGDFRLESGYNLTKEIMNMKEPPSAIFVSNNMMTLGCIKALFEMNLKIPQDIAIIGFDDIEMLNVMNVNISTVSRPTTLMGEEAMNILMERLNNKEGDNKTIKKVILPPCLTLRGSEKYIKE
jgi:LacI family transcriptional regulator